MQQPRLFMPPARPPARPAAAANPAYRGVGDAVMQTLRKEGPLAFWAGFSSNFLRLGSWWVGAQGGGRVLHLWSALAAPDTLGKSFACAADGSYQSQPLFGWRCRAQQTGMCMGRCVASRAAGAGVRRPARSCVRA